MDAYVTGTSRYYQDIHPDDTYWCFADIGWITGHSFPPQASGLAAPEFSANQMTQH
jgi:acyl-coenzyme A synthetase/AMP-(fatty) acid ligase